MYRIFTRVFIFFFFIAQFLWGILPFSNTLFVPLVEASQPYQTGYVTMGNSRLSFKAAIAGALAANATLVTIGTGNTAPDTVIDNLFPNDQICFNGSAAAGCKNSNTSTTYLVANIPGSTGSQLFSINTGLTGTMNTNDFVVSSQTGYMTVTFRPNQNIAVGDTIQIIIPAASSSSTDGIPDSTGFDSAGLPSNLLTGTNPNNGGDCNAGSVKRCLTTTGSGFTASSATLNTGSGSTHTISIISSNALSAVNTYTITVGETNPSNYGQGTLRFVNPAPASGHTRGLADTYSVTLQTASAGNLVDKTIMKVAPNDGVFVSANVELSITYTINDGVGSSYIGVGSSGCPNHSNSIAATATTVPFGSILNVNTFYNATQTHSVVTNGTNGYVLTGQEDGVMTNLTSGTIVNTSCDSSCTSSSGTSWSTATNNGFGYSLNSLTGSDAATSGTIYRQFSTSPVTIMSSSSPTNLSRSAVCYRLSVNATQQTGFYFNKLTYVATPRF